MDENNENSHDSKSDINKPFECDVCHKTYSTSVKLHYHKRTHKPKKFEISVCEHCNESFPTKKHLIAHRSKFHKVRILKISLKQWGCDDFNFSKLRFYKQRWIIIGLGHMPYSFLLRVN